MRIEPAEAAEQPDYLEHRKRLKARFVKAGADGLGPHELLEMVLFSAFPRQDTKPIARLLLKRFGNFAEVVAAPRERLKEIDGVGDAVVTTLKIVEAAAQELLKQRVPEQVVLSSWTAVVSYCRAQMAYEPREQFRVLFLDKRNKLVEDKVFGIGTVDHAPVYPREVIGRGLAVNATAMILVHNHPSGDPTPSSADVQMTQQIITLAKPFGIEVHDHLIVGRHGESSLRKLRLI